MDTKFKHSGVLYCNGTKKAPPITFPREKGSSYLTASAQRKRGHKEGHKEAPSLARIKAKNSKKFEKIDCNAICNAYCNAICNAICNANVTLM